jgi:hypothetical protein
MRKLVIMLFVFNAVAMSTSAQTTGGDYGPSWWPINEEGWKQCLDLSVPGNPYLPQKERPCPFNPETEYRAGFPEPGGCIVQVIPKSETPLKRGIVRVTAGTPTIFSRETGEPLRAEGCCNGEGEWRPFPQPEGKEGPTGSQGPKGDKGDKGDTPVIDEEAMRRVAIEVAKKNAPPRFHLADLVPDICKGSRTRNVVCIAIPPVLGGLACATHVGGLCETKTTTCSVCND